MSELDSLFEYVEGLSSENLTSAVLAYLLEHEDYIAFTRLLLLRVLGEDFDTKAANNFSIKTEASLDKYGRVDIHLESSEWEILIENKFFAGFSGGDQIKQYANYLISCPKKNKVLVLLCPQERGRYYLGLIEKQLGTNVNLQSSPIERISSSLRQSGIKFVLLPWEVLLNDFQSGNIVVSNLLSFISNRYLKNTTLSKGELELLNVTSSKGALELLNDTSVPELLEKLWAGIDKVKDALSHDFTVKRTSQSRLFYGFFIEESWGQVWVGLYITTWKDNKTPFIIQVRENWISDKVNADTIIKVLKNINFKIDAEYGYIYPINVKSSDLVGEIEQGIKSQLNTIRSRI